MVLSPSSAGSIDGCCFWAARTAGSTRITTRTRQDVGIGICRAWLQRVILPGALGDLFLLALNAATARGLGAGGFRGETVVGFVSLQVARRPHLPGASSRKRGRGDFIAIGKSFCFFFQKEALAFFVAYAEWWDAQEHPTVVLELDSFKSAPALAPTRPPPLKMGDSMLSAWPGGGEGRRRLNFKLSCSSRAGLPGLPHRCR